MGWWILTVVSAVQLLVGLLVLFKRPRDFTAIAAGIFLCCMGTGNELFFLTPSAAVMWRTLPLFIQSLIFPVAVLGSDVLPIPMLWFALSFPKLLLQRRWAWTMMAVLSVPLISFATIVHYVTLFAPNSAVQIPSWLVVIVVIDFLITFLASLTILAVNCF
jgi:hypothetical protein